MSTQQKNKPRLGRGLSSLISISELPVEAEIKPKPAVTPTSHPPSPTPQTNPTEIPLAQIQPNPHQPRRSFDESTLVDLAASIKSTGLIQPILVRKVGQQYQLIAGERRLRAAKLAGLSTIPALLRDIDTVTQAQMALIENIQREDLNPIDRAQGYRALIDQLGLTQAELAGRLGEDRSSIANFLRLLDLSDSVKTMVRDGRLSVGHAKLIAGISDILEQERLANLVLLQGLSVRNLERAIKEGPRHDTKKTAPTGPAAHLQDLEKTISRQLGLRIQLRAAAKKGKGRLIIHYASLDQFDELLARLKVSAE
ncbi:MAG TPA: ParB/RepB/Spo0J family partition protein [Tepidisphaeraceae bacterium]|jgi:ParB family chromosome partitioning protein|nr:ParB/RepB/Spo0J family partition protein [Tepidisphaeraceae bacterium]